MDEKKIIETFKTIESKGFIASNRLNNTGIGKTFEDLANIQENNKKEPDLYGFEIKTKRKTSKSLLTLFTKSPSGFKGATKHLRDTYGQHSSNGFKRIHTAMDTQNYNTFVKKFGFKLKNNKIDKKIEILVKNLKDGNIINTNIYWDYLDLEKAFMRKLKNLMFVNAECKTIDSIEYFHYNSCELYLEPNFDKFIEMIDSGEIRIEIRIGTYKTGKRKGKTHNHGIAFRLKQDSLKILYLRCKDII